MEKEIPRDKPLRGYARASLYRSSLLVEMEADEETIRSAENQPLVEWNATGLTTCFTLEKPRADQPYHCPFNVRTFLAVVTDVEAARFWVNELNTFTSLVRWLLVTNEEAGEIPQGISRGDHYVVADYSTMLGNPVTEVPFRVAEMAIREQITKSWVLASNGFAEGWGNPALFDGSSVVPEDTSEFDVNCDYFDLYVTPRSTNDATGLISAADEAFRREVEAQLNDDDLAWLGFANPQFEVPFGFGKFDGAVTHIANGGDDKNDTSTSLVKASVTSHPHLGNGIVCWLQIPITGISDPLATVERLNKQNSPISAQLEVPISIPHFAHSLGAWVVRDEEIVWAAFVPAAFRDLIDAESLVNFFRELWQDCARNSFAAHALIERNNFEKSGASNEFGLRVDSARIRGAAYGEIGGGDRWYEYEGSAD
jgi:hypothetical protein